MSGVVCRILSGAIVVDKASDAQWRALFSQADVAQSVANDTGSAGKLCDILDKPAFSAADKVWFEQLVKSLWANYS